MVDFIVHQGLHLRGSNQPKQPAVHTACHTEHHEELFVMCQAFCRMEDWKNITLPLKNLQIS